MPDRTTMPDFSDELLRLRRRAYGPIADGELEAADLTRLRELEALARAQSVPAAAEGELDETADAAGSTPAPADAAPRDGVGDGGGETPPAPDIVAERPRSVGPRTAALAAAGVVGCALIGAWLTVALAPPAPDAVLQPVQETGVPDFIEQTGMFDYLEQTSMLDYLGLDPETTVVAYEPHQGLQAYTFTASGGDGCLLVSVDNVLGDFACGRGRLDATVDMVPGASGASPGLMPWITGTLVRLVARDGVVEVWVEESAP